VGEWKVWEKLKHEWGEKTQLFVLVTQDNQQCRAQCRGIAKTATGRRRCGATISILRRLNQQLPSVKMPSEHKCAFCSKRVPTLKGLRSHMAQRELCRNAMRKVAAQRLPKNHSENGSTHSQQYDDIDMADVDIPDAFDLPQPEFDMPHQSPPPSVNAGQPEQPDRRARVEEVEDEEAGGIHWWVEDYPRPAGMAGQAAQSYFERIRVEQVKQGQDPWVPFEDQEEWELAEWLIMNVGQNA
jgi:hypothetical protein